MDRLRKNYVPAYEALTALDVRNSLNSWTDTHNHTANIYHNKQQQKDEIYQFSPVPSNDPFR